MSIWRIKLVMVATVLMLMAETYGAQVAPAVAAAPATPASATTRGASRTPYIPPVTVPSVAGQIQPLRLPSPTISVTSPTAPSFSSGCDSSGCWGSDGTRYNAIGGALVRPDGRMCQNVGGVMQCP